MENNKRQKIVHDYISKGDWDRAIEHAKMIPDSWDVWQQMPSAGEDGMPDSAIHKVLDHLERHGLMNESGFFYEMASNLLGHNQSELLQRMAAIGSDRDDYLSNKSILSHPNYKPTQEHKDLTYAHEFWKNYERKVHPSHFAVVKSLYTGKPETVKHRGIEGTSAEDDPAIPHMRDYAKKIQEKVLADPELRFRDYNGEKYVKVFRGIGGHYSKMIRDAAKYDTNTKEYDAKKLVIPVAPFSSWTADVDMAERFAKGRGADLEMHGHGLVLSKWMPVKDILHSGYHRVIPGRDGIHPNEKELVFGHPTGKMKISTNELHFEDPLEDDDSQFGKGIKRQKDLSKSVKHTALALATAASMMGIPSKLADAIQDQKQHQIADLQEKPKVFPLPGLKYIEMIESSGGKNLKHPLVNSGLNAGTRAIGKYGIMPLQALETVKKDPVLARKYSDFLQLDHVKDHDKIHHAVLNSPDMETEIANSHWKRLHDRFDGNEAKMAHAWFNGVSGTLQKPQEDIINHDYVKKYKRYKKMMSLERPKGRSVSMQKSESSTPVISNSLQEFLFFGVKSSENIEKVKEINKLIQSKAFHSVPSIGQFTSDSLVIGTSHEDSWLLKIESGARPAITSAKAGLQSVKEVAFYDIASSVFGLQDFVPDALLGEAVFPKENKPAAAIKMLPKKYKLAVDLEEERPGSIYAILEKYRKTSLLHKMASMLYILGDGDSHGRNVMSDGFFIKLIDHGSAFADEKFNPVTDQNIFIPYILRAGRMDDNISKEDKLQKMPKIDSLGAKDELRSWILSLNSDKLAQKLNNYGIDPKPSIDRLKKLQKLVSEGTESDLAVNQVWTVNTGE